MELFIEQPQIYQSDIKILNESKDRATGKWSVTFNSILQDVSKPTANKRFYSKQLMEQGIRHLEQNFIKRNHLYGEYDHPLADLMKATSDEMAFKRHISVLLEKVSHQFLKLWIDGPYIMGTIKTLHTKYGQELTNLIVLDKAAVGFSLRSAGMAKPNPATGYQEIIPSSFVIVTWDAVINPASQIAVFNPQNSAYTFNESVEYSSSRCVNGVCELIQKHPEMLNETNEHVKSQLIKNKVSMIIKQKVKF